MRSRYEQMAKEAFEREIKAYLDSQVEHHHGLMPSSWKLERQHFDWLALYQCGDKPKSEIAKKLKAKRTTFDSAIQDLAHLISLTLRADARGRPPGTKDKRKRERRN
jgi:hypothetical protein